ELRRADYPSNYPPGRRMERLMAAVLAEEAALGRVPCAAAFSFHGRFLSSISLEWQIASHASSPWFHRRDFETCAYRAGPILHDVKSHAGSVARVVTNSNSVIGHT